MAVLIEQQPPRSRSGNHRRTRRRIEVELAREPPQMGPHRLVADIEARDDRRRSDRCLRRSRAARPNGQRRPLLRARRRLRLPAPDLVAVRAALTRRWWPWLTAQDRQKFRAHVTVQNKVAPEQARALHAALHADFAPLAATGEVLRLWRYLGGPWEPIAAYPFEDTTQKGRQAFQAQTSQSVSIALLG